MALNTFMSYPLWTLSCTLFFPVIASIAIFVCLRRARTSRKIVSFFVIIPLFAALIVVFLGDTGSIMSNLLASVGLYYPPVIGFIAAITLGIFCLDIMALVGGAGLLKVRGAITNAIATVIALGAEIFILYSAWICRLRLEEIIPDSLVITIGESLPFLSFLPKAILDSGIEFAAISVLVIYIIVYFLSFIAVRSVTDIARANVEHRRAASKISQNPSPANTTEEREEELHCCAFCEHATLLKGDRIHMVCDSFGVVSSSHTCRKFLYDPLKRGASRPKATSPQADELPFFDLNNI